MWCLVSRCLHKTNTSASGFAKRTEPTWRSPYHGKRTKPLRSSSATQELRSSKTSSCKKACLLLSWTSLNPGLQIVPSYHNDVFWFYAHTSFEHGQDGVHCLDGLCRHRFVPTLRPWEWSKYKIAICQRDWVPYSWYAWSTGHPTSLAISWIQRPGIWNHSLIDDFLIFVTHEKR